MAGPAIKYQYGPYYESAISKSQPQRTALGQPALSPAQLAGISQGELEARYNVDIARQQQATTTRFKEEELSMQKEARKAEERSSMVMGVGGTAIAGGMLAGALVPGVAATATTAATAGMIMGVPAGPFGMAIGALVGIGMGIAGGSK